jgi:hypothetical protein
MFLKPSMSAETATEPDDRSLSVFRAVTMGVL